jgi:hypothetical protein
MSVVEGRQKTFARLELFVTPSGPQRPSKVFHFTALTVFQLSGRDSYTGLISDGADVCNRWTLRHLRCRMVRGAIPINV